MTTLSLDTMVTPSFLAAYTPDGKELGDHEVHEDRTEAKAMQRRFAEYLRTEGQLLESYVGKSKRPQFIGSAKLPRNAVAANVRTNTGLEGIVSNRDYAGKVQRLAHDYGLNWDEASTYVLAHEHTHTLDPAKEGRSPIGAEKYVEATLASYFTKRAMETKGPEQAKYQKLAATAKARLGALKGMNEQQYQQQVHSQQAAQQQYRVPQTPHHNQGYQSAKAA